MKVMDNLQIRKLLPHRYPFLLVDKVVAIETGKQITAIKNVTANEPFFNGHFPDAPIMPGVLMIEAMAQASGLLVLEELGLTERIENEMFFLAGVDEVRFKRMVFPGDVLQLNVELVKHRLNLWKFKGMATVNGELACSAIFMIIREL
jgi:3-hydroxyacyl-[acyl-carrier-protein] dehydratase